MAHSRFRSCQLLIAASALALGACSSKSTDDGDALTIGLLLPFTGSSSATASNFERAALYAVGRVNDAGGIHGRRLRIVSEDTHSDVARAIQSAHKLIDAGATVVIGPESADIAPALVPLFTSHHIALISPLVGAGAGSSADCVHPWFRLAPSATDMGEALAKQLYAQNLQKVAVLYATDAYDLALSDAVKSRFVALGGSVAVSAGLDPNAQSYAGSISQVIQAKVDAVVLATSPTSGALVVNEFDALAGAPPRWFLSPLLKTALLVENVAPEALEGAFGVAPKIYDTSNDFPSAFATRWQGDEPLEGAYFYYDAVALSALALETQAGDSSDAGVLDSFDAALFNVAAPPGQSSGWNDFTTGLARIGAGVDIYYSGLTGPMLLDRCGPRKLGASSNWTVRGGQILNQ